MEYTNALKIHKNWLLKKIPWTELFQVQESFIWYLDYDNKQWQVIVPEWFETNFWSIPRFMRPFINRTKYIAYILHDYLWSKDSEIIYWNIVFSPTFMESNQILRDAMSVEWAGFFERYIIYIWLWYTIFPYIHYMKCKK